VVKNSEDDLIGQDSKVPGTGVHGDAGLRWHGDGRVTAGCGLNFRRWLNTKRVRRRRWIIKTDRR
jgi:hypothetical protein